MPQLVDLIVDGRIASQCRCPWKAHRPLADSNRNRIQNILRHSPEKFLHLPIKLRRQCLVVGNDQCWLVQRLNDIGHGKGFTRTSDTKQRLELIALFKTLHQLGMAQGWSPVGAYSECS